LHGPAAILLAAFALALLTSFLFTFVTDYLDPSFHTPAQVINILGIPVVIAVPKRTA
jgi:capsular polysaccharide biosynthesis protein